MKLIKWRIRNKYAIETIVFVSYVLFAMAWVGGTASMEQIMAQLHINSLASASFISGAVTIAKIVGTFLAAWFAIKVGIKKAFFLAGVLITVGIVTPVSTNYEILLVSRFLVGLGGALMIVYFNPIVMSCFTPEERPTINGINAVAFNVGTAIVLWQMANINLVVGGWKNSLILFSVISLLLAVLWLFVEIPLQKIAHHENDNSMSVNVYWQALKTPFNWHYALTYSGILALYICLFTFFPKAGISLTATVIGFGIIGTIAGIFYSQKFLSRIPVVRWSGLVITLSVFGLSFSTHEVIQIASATLLGFFIFFPITALVSIPHEIRGMTTTGIAVVFSLFYSISYFIATISLWCFGKLVDLQNGDYQLAFVFIGLLSASFFFGSFWLPETQKSKFQSDIKNKETKLCKE